MAKPQKKQGFTLLWEREDKQKLARLMEIYQKTTRERVTQSTAIQRAVELALETLDPSYLKSSALPEIKLNN